MTYLIGPFKQLLTFEGLKLKGPIQDQELIIHQDAGILVSPKGLILKIGKFLELKVHAKKNKWKLKPIEKNQIALPGFIDCHTHICWGGNRIVDYQKRIAGLSYQEIAQSGGGIQDTVQKTRSSSDKELLSSMLVRCHKLLQSGVTSVEVKSGYGLSVDEEIRILKVIQNSQKKTKLNIISTCLAAHTLPKDFKGSKKEYLNHLSKNLLPIIKTKKLSHRVDIFIDEHAFQVDDARSYLKLAQDLGFALTIHADQFSSGGSALAVELNALSADHLEASTTADIQKLASSDVVAVVLPGASLGLGIPHAPARKLLDAGASVAIASDWNPGSAPMGDLLTQSAILSAYEKLTSAETFAGITFRAAKALGIENTVGKLVSNYQADFITFPTNDFREILYSQGQLRPSSIWKKGLRVYG